MQAPRFECLSFDPFALFQNCSVSAEVDVSRYDVVQAFVVSLMAVVIDEGFEVTLQEIIFQQDTVFQRVMPSLDFALGLQMIGRTTRVLHAFVVQPFRQFARDITGAVIAKPARLMGDMYLIVAKCLQREVSRGRHIFSPHVDALLPGNDVAAVIVEDRAEIEPPPPKDLDVGEVRLP